MSLRSRILPLFSLTVASTVLATSVSAQDGDRSSDHKVGLREHRPNVWALQHARVVVNSERTLGDATVVVRNGLIESVEKGGAVPVDARVIDVRGKTVYPGFIDAYSEVSLSTDGIQQAAKYWNPNVVPQLSVADQFVANSQNKDLRRQGFVAQLRAPSGKIIRGQSALVSTGATDPNVAVLVADVAQHLQQTPASRSRDVYPNSPMGAVALCRQAMYDANWYRDAWKAADADASLPRPERNDALAALQPVINDTQPVIIETSNELFVLRANRFAGEFGLNLIVKGNGYEYRRLKEIAATQRPLILPLNFSKAPNVSTAEVAQNVTLTSLMHWDIAPENPARADEAGIRFAFCTDRLSSPNDFLKSLRKAVQRGLAKKSALKALTETPAQLFDVEDQLGSIQSGKLASFVITDGDIFDGKTKVVETWVGGERFEHSPEPEHDLTGHLVVQLQETEDYAAELFVELKRDGKKVSGRVAAVPFDELKSKNDEKESEDEEGEEEDEKEQARKKPAAVAMKEVSLRDFTAAGQFDAKSFGGSGKARLTLVFSRNDSSKEPTAFGQVVWPDGSTALATAERLPTSKDGDDKKEEKKDEAPQNASFAVNYPLGAFGVEQAPPSDGAFAFVNATIWTCGPQGIIGRGTILFDKGRIVEVGAKVDIPDGVTKFNVRGMHITPGIIDCHSHIATDGGVNESAQATTCEVRIGDFIDCDDISIYRQLAGGVTTSNILHGSANPIGGQNQVLKFRWGSTGEEMKFQEAPAGVKFALGENVKQSNWGDDNKTRYPQTRMGVEQTFRDAFEAAKEYADRMDAYAKNRRGLPPRRDLELDALREIVEQKRWIHCHSYRQDEILALIRVLDDYNITIGTFQHILEGYKVADAMAKHGAMGSAFSDWWAYKFEVYDAIPYAGALMHEAGVVVSFNSDDAELATHLNQEAAKAVKYGGVSEEEALKFVTLNPAKQLRIDQYVGSLEVGKHADLVVWNRSPLSNYARCEQTWIDGQLYFSREQDAAARAAAADMRNTLIQKILTSGEKMAGKDEKDEKDEKEDDPSAMWPRYDEFCRATGHIHQKQK